MNHINNLPDEVLEFIMGHLPPYKDLDECSLVCKRWNRIVHSVKRHTHINLNKGLNEFNLCWKTIAEIDKGSIGGRFSHSSIVHENSMYIFGGGSSTDTTFNDLWRFDLSTRQWIRPLTRGKYPSPKACATMVYYKNHLILFGGWRHPPSYPPHQQWCLFDELHAYNIMENRWIALPFSDGPPPMTGHSATVHNNLMIVFGGYRNTDPDNISSTSNEIWSLNLDTYTWQKPQVSDTKPQARYGQFQIALDETNLLILGGCGGPNNLLSDAWILNISMEVWKWRAVTINNKKWSATHMWCYPACKVGTKLVVLGPTTAVPSDFQMVRNHMPSSIINRNRPCQRHPQQQPPPPPQQAPQPAQIQPAQSNRNRIQIMEEANRRLQEQRNRPINRENINLNVGPSAAAGASAAAVPPPPPTNSNHRINTIEEDAVHRLQRNLQLRGREDVLFLPKRFDEPIPNERLGLVAFIVNDSSTSTEQRERQLERLRRMAEKINAMRRTLEQPADEIPNPKRMKRNCIGLFVCDIENILENEPTLDWIESKNYGIIDGAPERLILSSIVAGNGELVIFGGLNKESLSDTPGNIKVSNSIHFLTYPRGII